MDKERQIRFLYPPLIFILYILLAVYYDPSVMLQEEISKFWKIDNQVDVVVALIGASSGVLVIGFLLGTLNVCILRLLFKVIIKNRGQYEVKLSDTAYEEIGKTILKRKDDKLRQQDQFYAGIVFDHGFINKNTHGWIIRRWNAFFIGSSSCVAIMGSLTFCLLAGIKVFWTVWLVYAVIGLVIFVYQSSTSWKETMRMIEFMTRVRKPEEIQDPIY